MENSYESGKGVHAITSGIEGPWTTNPIQWDMGYLTLLFKYEWECQKRPGGAWQWHPVDCEEADMVPQGWQWRKGIANDDNWVDISMKVDPIYREICQKFLADPDAFGEAFAKAWFKLLHRDMGPKSNYVARDFKDVEYIWQDPVPAGKFLSPGEENEVRTAIAAAGIDNAKLIETAWASASTFEGLTTEVAPMVLVFVGTPKDWAVNQPKQLSST